MGKKRTNDAETPPKNGVNGKETLSLVPKQDENAPKKVKVQGVKAAKIKQRRTLGELLLADPEYANLDDHIAVDEEIVRTLDSEVSQDTKLSNLKNVMAVLYADIQGLGATQIAANMNLTRAEVQAIRRSVAYVNAKASVLQEVINTSRGVMEVSALRAVKTLTECMNSKNDKVKLNAAVEVLNRIGLGATQKVELTTHNEDYFRKLTNEELTEIVKSSVVEADGVEVVINGE
jgi:hypothetical protein